jgi:hypothetical protein
MKWLDWPDHGPTSVLVFASERGYKPFYHSFADVARSICASYERKKKNFYG